MSLAQRIAESFALGGRILDVRPYGQGLINDTFLVTLETGQPRRVILQRLNRQVFPKPALIMENLRTLLEHVQRRQAVAGLGTRDLRLPQLYRTRDQKDFVTDSGGEIWRALSFIEQSRTLERLTHPSQAEEVGFALGWFHHLIHDLDLQRLHDTLPGFHNTPHYLARFTEAVSRLKHTPDDPAWHFCVSFIEARRSRVDILEAARAARRLAVRAVHGDPKVDNFLFDEQTNRVASLIDLDTVKPGLVHYDIGDCLRSCCNPAGESPADPTTVGFDLDLCRALLKAYFAETRRFLPVQEWAYLYGAIWLIPFELGVRFLTDHVEGNQYFKTVTAGQNLARARVQLELTASIERNEKHIKSLIAEITGDDSLM